MKIRLNEALSLVAKKLHSINTEYLYGCFEEEPDENVILDDERLHDFIESMFWDLGEFLKDLINECEYIPEETEGD